MPTRRTTTRKSKGTKLYSVKQQGRFKDIQTYKRAHSPLPLRVDHHAMLSIQTLLDGVEWSSDTLEAIAKIMTNAGYPIRDIDE
jgi:hypothetical protein